MANPLDDNTFEKYTKEQIDLLKNLAKVKAITPQELIKTVEGLSISEYQLDEILLVLKEGVKFKDIENLEDVPPSFKEIVNLTEELKKKVDASDEKNNAIITNLGQVLKSGAEQTAELVTSTKDQVVQTIELQGIVQSQLGPLTPIMMSINEQFKKIGKRIWGWFSKWIVEKLKMKKWWGWIKEDINWRKIRWKSVLSFIFFLPVLLAALFSSATLALWKQWKGLPGIKQTLNFFKKLGSLSLTKFLNIFKTGKLAPIGNFLLRIGNFFKEGQKGFKVLQKFKSFISLKWLTTALKFLSPAAQRIGSLLGGFLGRLILPVTMIYRMIKGIFSPGSIRDKILAASAGILSVIFEIPEMIGNAILWLARKIFGAEFLAGFKFDFGQQAIIDGINMITEAVGYVVEALDPVWQGIGWLMDTLVEFFSRTLGPVIDSFKKIFSGDIMGGIWDLLKAINPLRMLKDFLRDMYVGLFDAIGSIFGIEKIGTRLENTLYEMTPGFLKWMWGKRKGPEEIKEEKKELEVEKTRRILEVLKGKRISELSEEERGTIRNISEEFKKQMAEVEKGGEVPSAQKGAVIKKTGLVYAHKGEIITKGASVDKSPGAVEKATTIEKTAMLTKLTELTESIKENTSKVASIKENAASPITPQLQIRLDNIPTIIEDTGLILVSSGVI